MQRNDTECWWENRKERGFGEKGIDGRITWILKEDDSVRTGLIWLRTETNGRLL
jgi:hypothetical protein